MDKIGESFNNVRRDISSLYSDFYSLKTEFNEIKDKISKLCELLTKLNSQTIENTPSDTSTHDSLLQTTSTHSSTHIDPFKALKDQNMTISIRNEGVPTDRQTDRQTDNTGNIGNSSFEVDSLNSHSLGLLPDKNPIQDATKILDSLDSIKKELRLKFKRLTEQEFLVFSTLYQIEDNEGSADYRILSKTLGLTESSIRDYIGRLIKKGIPVDKKRINNKNISLSISPNLRKISSLPTILRLRDI